MLSAVATDSSGNNLRLFRNELSKLECILVIDFSNLVSAENANFSLFFFWRLQNGHARTGLTELTYHFRL